MNTPPSTIRKLDATGKILGRFASEIAVFLRGKHKATFVPNQIHGDIVEVENVKALQVTGNKLKQKMYKHFSGYPGGLKSVSLEVLLKKDPAAALRHAVKGMLPKNKLQSRLLTRLHIR